MTHTVVCFHAHPDDEALLMGGSIARLAAEGHRIVLVTATAGERGASAAQLSQHESLGTLRGAELEAAARILGCARVVFLGYRDSGSDRGHASGPESEETFATMPIEVAARELSLVLADEAADVLTIYDPAGGYGHPDHVQVNRVGRRAADLAGTPLVLEVTVNRQLLQRALTLVRLFRPASADFAPSRFNDLYSDPARITHRVDVRRYLPQKRAAMQAHQSQTMTVGPDDTDRTLAWILRLPALLFRLGFGHEWFVEHGRTPDRVLLDDLLTTLRRVEPAEDDR